MAANIIIDECDYITHAAALIFYHTGKNPDEMEEEDFVNAYARIEYCIRKTRKGR